MILCNHTSYIDVLYLSFRYAPVFATPVHDGSRIVFRKRDVFGALYDTVTDASCGTDTTGTTVRTADALQLCSGPADDNDNSH